MALSRFPRSGSLPIDSFLLQSFAQRGDDFNPRVPGENQIRGVVQPVEVDALAETNLVAAIHAVARSIRIQGTTTSSKEAPPCPTTRSPFRTNAVRPGASRATTVFGKPDGGPCDGVRELLMYARAQHFVGIDPRALTPYVSDHAFGWPPASLRLDVSVVGCQVNREPVAEQLVQKPRHEPFAGPLPDLVVHARSAQLHAVHDPVDLVDDQAKRADVIPRQDLADAVEGAVSQPLGVTDGPRRRPLVHPESTPQ